MEKGEKGGEREKRTEQKLRSSQKTLSGFSLALSGGEIGGVRDANNDSESDAATVNVKCQGRTQSRSSGLLRQRGGPDTSSSKVGGREGVRGNFSRNWSIGQSVHCAAVTLASIRVQTHVGVSN